MLELWSCNFVVWEIEAADADSFNRWLSAIVFSMFCVPMMILFEVISSIGMFFFGKNVDTFVCVCYDFGDITGTISASLLMLLLLFGDSLMGLSFQSSSLFVLLLLFGESPGKLLLLLSFRSSSLRRITYLKRCNICLIYFSFF